MVKMTTSSTDAAAAAVAKMIGPWTRACLDRDWDALLGMCTSDIVFMPPGEAPVSGAAVRAWLEAFPPIKRMSWEVTSLEAAEDQAFLRGPVRQTVVVEGVDEPFEGKYCDLMRREEDGAWRFAVIMWNSNTA